MANIHAANKGRKVQALATNHRCLAVDFPGWGSVDHAEFLLPIVEGKAGTVTNVESHGSNPHTLYTVAFEDGTMASGLAIGVDIEFA